MIRASFFSFLFFLLNAETIVSALELAQGALRSKAFKICSRFITTLNAYYASPDNNYVLHAFVLLGFGLLFGNYEDTFPRRKQTECLSDHLQKKIKRSPAGSIAVFCFRRKSPSAPLGEGGGRGVEEGEGKGGVPAPNYNDLSSDHFEFMYLVFTRMPGENYRRRLMSLLLYLCNIFRALINSLVC